MNKIYSAIFEFFMRYAKETSTRNRVSSMLDSTVFDRYFFLGPLSVIKRVTVVRVRGRAKRTTEKMIIFNYNMVWHSGVVGYMEPHG